VADFTEEQLLSRAKELQAERPGLSLTDAMIAAEDELQPEPTIPTSFTVTIPVKARVAKWILDEFGGHAKFPIEERLGAFLTTILSRTRVQAMRYAEEGEDVQEGKAVTLRREKFARKVPKQ
jgi:hypothetical protein